MYIATPRAASQQSLRALTWSRGGLGRQGAEGTGGHGGGSPEPGQPEPRVRFPGSTLSGLRRVATRNAGEPNDALLPSHAGDSRERAAPRHVCRRRVSPAQRPAPPFLHRDRFVAVASARRCTLLAQPVAAADREQHLQRQVPDPPQELSGLPRRQDPPSHVRPTRTSIVRSAATPSPRSGAPPPRLANAAQRGR